MEYATNILYRKGVKAVGKDARIVKLERAIRMAMDLAEKFWQDGYTTMADFWADAVIELQSQMLEVQAS